MNGIFHKTTVLSLLATGLFLGAAGCRGPVEERKVVVQNKGIHATVSAWEKRGGVWREVFRTEDGFVGQKGIVPAEEKREGDGATPAGEYVMRRAFGMVDDPETSLDYTRIEMDDMWVDDPNSKYYNQYVKASSGVKRDWSTAEELVPLGNIYKYAIVVEYNTDPVVKGKGSAIFLNNSRGFPTAGDIGVPEKYIKRFFKFVRPGDKIVIEKGD